MKPLPKWAGYLAGVAGLITTASQLGLFNLIPEAARVYVIAGCGAILAFTHSLNGTGGKPEAAPFLTDKGA